MAKAIASSPVRQLKIEFRESSGHREPWEEKRLGQNMEYATQPLFWLGLSFMLVAVSLTAVLVAAFPAFLELARAARSAEKLFDTLQRDFPPTLEALRLTGIEISELSGDLSKGVKGASQTLAQADRSLNTARSQARNLSIGTRSLVAGVKAAWYKWTRPGARRRF